MLASSTFKIRGNEAANYQTITKCRIMMKFRIELSTQGRKPEKRCKRDD